MAVRLEVLSREIANNLEASEPDEAMASWATLVTGLDTETVQKELDIFNTETVSFFNLTTYIPVV
jgi:hypothetical protein